MLVPRRVIQDNSAFFDETLINLEDVVWVGQLIDIINDFCYIDLNLYASLKKDIDEIIRILIASIKTTRKNEKYTGEILPE